MLVEVGKEVVQHQRLSQVDLSHELVDLQSHKLRTRTQISSRTCSAPEKNLKTYRLARKESSDWGLLTAPISR